MSRSCVRVASWVAGMSSMMAWASVASGQVVYEDVGGAAGMGQYRPAMGMSAGIAAADFDDDGDIDVYVPTIAGAPDQVYRNRGDGRFDEVGASLGLASPGNNRAGLWIDYDGDGRLDLLTLRDCHRIDGCADETSLRLYRQNESGGFDDVTAGAGLLLALSPPHLQKHAGGLAAGDLNGDGWLDIWVAMWRGMSHILINNGDGTFRDATAGSGVDILKAYWQPILTDINGDGLTDAWANVDFDPNHLWINNGDETFRDLAPAAGCATKYNEMGAAMGDYDNDGDFDFYASNIFQYSAIPDSHSVLYRNDSTPGSIRMTEVGFDAGVADTGWGWGATFLDADNDGLLDLAVTNGFFGSEPRFAVDPSRLYLNRGDGTFEDRAAACGFDD
ncbi:MAG: FG-GAP repeat domain-containing protein, partial [Phycisphaerales bacterium JB039]